MAERQGQFSETAASTDAAGRFEMLWPRIATTSRQSQGPRLCRNRSTGSASPVRRWRCRRSSSMSGGFIAGQVVNAKTGEAIAVTAAGQPIAIGLYGPAAPHGRTGAAARMAHTDACWPVRHPGGSRR